MASSSSSSSSSPDYTYDVFLSFRGDDVRLNYIGHLYKALTQRGVVTFKDDKSLQKGKSISPEIKSSIQSSRFAIVVFSENYANSSWCMEELVEIFRCMDAGLIAVLPIFHGVDPSDVRKQRGNFALDVESFKEDEKDRVFIWRDVLTKAANLGGWDGRNRDEATVIEEVVKHVLTQLSHITSRMFPGLVGMGTRMNKMKSLLQVGLNDVRMVGICGMGGIGKTTIAEQIYRGVSRRFDGCCFLERVREAMKNPDGRSNLQKQLLSSVLGLQPQDNMKPIDLAMRSKCVLIVLDDVEDIHHLETLAGKHDWFGPGSRIIITTRNKQILEAHGVDEVYEVELLNDLESLKLFKQYAFRSSSETNELAALSQQVVNYAKGHPLAVKVLGSSLTKKSARQWRDELAKLKVYPPEEVQNVLQLSFLGLNPTLRKIFLDIACFFNGYRVERVIDFWESSGLFPVSGLSTLQGKCLITIIQNKILMHDMLQEMGRNIVREKSEDPGERSRLWNHNDIYNVLLENKGTNKIEGIVLDLSITNETNFEIEAFSTMTKLRLLKIYCGHFPTVYEYPFSKDLYLRINPSEREETFPNFSNVLTNEFTPSIVHSEHTFRNLTSFSNELRCLCWHGYPLEYLPTSFYPRNLVELNMSYSRVTKFWTERKQFDKLKIINFCNSKELIATPDFTGMPNLEILVLKGCTSLKEVHPSVGFLKNLQLLDLEGCESVQKFPNVIDMKSLEVFLLSGCVLFELFPNIQGYMQHVAVLNLDETAVKDIPDSIELLSGLQVLSARNCKCLTHISINITQLKALRILNLSGCSNLKELPENLAHLQDLEELRLDETGVTMPPTSIGFLKKLQVLSFRGCPFNESSLPEEFPQLPLLRTPLCLENWIFVNLSSLTDLDLSYCKLLSSSISWEFSFLSSMRRLNLSGNLFEHLPDSVCSLPNLEVLRLAHCRFLFTLSALPSSIYYIDASNCCRLLMVEYPAGVNVSCMRSFNFMNCTYLRHNVELVARHIRKTSLQFSEFSIIIPGSGIPMWSGHETAGLSANMDLPNNWYGRTFKGLALWVVFSVLEPPLFHMNQQKKKTFRLDFELKCDNHSLIAENGFTIDGETHTLSDHVWLHYFPSSLFKRTTYNKGPSHIEVFLTTKEPGLVVKRCGLYPLCLDWGKNTLMDIHSNWENSSARMLKSIESEHPCHVFLSFEGENIHFMVHLRKALSQVGIATSCSWIQKFAKEMPNYVKKKIQNSRIAIVVFTNNYVKSTQCLEELTEIIHCMKAGSLRVLPIFLGVVTFAPNLENLKEDERHRIPMWSSALNTAANLLEGGTSALNLENFAEDEHRIPRELKSCYMAVHLPGWGIHNRGRDDSIVIEEVIMRVTRMRYSSSNIATGLVGMESHIDKLLSLLEVRSTDVRIIGICGMGGIGKTTISEQIYLAISRKFEASCFLRGVSEAMNKPDGYRSLQSQIGYVVSKRVLIVLDGVEHIEHLEALACSRNWFDPGSRIIITSRDRQLLEAHGVDKVYEVEHLNDSYSYILFKIFAFMGRNEMDELEILSEQVVEYAKNLPLAVKVLGSSLRKRTVREWEDELDRLKTYPLNGLQSVFEVIFNGLDPAERKMFLDIACFFNGDCADKVNNFLKIDGLSALAKFRSLRDKCLVTIIDDKILMHHWVQEMGRKIVLEESENPGKRSRLWDHKDVVSVLAELKGTNKVEGMVLNLSRTNKEIFKFEAFSRMSNLRLLKVYHAHLPTNYEYFPGNISTYGNALDRGEGASSST